MRARSKRDIAAAPLLSGVFLKVSNVRARARAAIPPAVERILPGSSKNRGGLMGLIGESLVRLRSCVLCVCRICVRACYICMWCGVVRAVCVFTVCVCVSVCVCVRKRALIPL